ncbi:hypothetical protein [Myroides odoratus]|uniref:Uncharacterized protein n=1 Tax=Myroides odoratus TaxID=256 RepID=A0A9Q6Z393_MYROD|nr:hypothetical protein [Myroides odoratus]EHQ41864.1 hypothetical protein Myrod_1030 [Myroides odoratus DSM 2801]EKB09130.1 hypothetical protein HMPREF9716_00414 [Myroides odoratus CIP 103059]QQT99258.1 hypothetical protein I6I88_13750 [Myroides odoratus]WQD58543.1 hypothetical protein U0010_05210 [Myroides odoratus]STZ29125.1 Uncharacterised protein [Myroides odoratus]
MERLIKLIWDFRGPDAEKIANHHVIHLREFVAMEKLPLTLIDKQVLSDVHSIAYLVVNDEQMRTLRDVLKPHRGELYEQ